MTIQIRVYSISAQKQIRALEAEVAMLQKQVAAANRTMNGLGAGGIRGITRWGNQIQWAGRQLQYNFTLPILLAGGAAAKFALDNEKAMVRVKKVYGDTSFSAQLVTNEIEALGRAFEALSNRFAVNQAETINIAADWAAAGASGLALAKSVKLTMETMVLGELEAVEATEALIAIQAQYGFGVDKLSKTIDILNMTENQTGITMKGLIQGMARTAGVARTAGIDVEHLAAMMASLVPATGSATQAGNGLKTIISRFLSPTNEAAQVMKMMGINTAEVGWQSMNATQRLEKMAEAFQDLNQQQRVVVTSTIASRWQVNRFDVLMRDIANTNGYYQKSLAATANEQEIFNQRVRELNAVLDSNPHKVKQVWVIIQNAMARAIQPMIPVIVMLGQEIAKVATAFSNLNPMVQKAVMFSLLLLAVIGPIARYIGSVAVLIGLLSEAFASAARWVGKFGYTLLWLIRSPFALFGKAAGAAFAIGPALKGMQTSLVKTFPWFTKWALGAAAALKAAFAVSLLPVFKMMGAYAMVALRSMGGIMIAGFALMGRNIAAIWTGTWLMITKVAAAGTAMAQAVVWVFSRNLILMFTVLGSNIIAIATKMMGAVVLAFSRIGTMLPLLFARIGAVLSVAMTQMAALVARGAALMWAAMTGPVGITIAAVIGLVAIFHKQITAAFRSLVENAVEAFWKLPQGVRDAMLAVIRVVQAAVMKVYEWFSYLNPFARHSPSLVDQVTAGMAVIRDQYASIGNVGAPFAKAAADLARYKSLISGLQGNEWGDERADVAAQFPSALGAFDSLVEHLKVLTPLMARQEAAVNKQQAVVDAWDAALNQANLKLDEQQRILDKLEDRLGALTDAYSEQKNILEGYANTPIAGMGAMSDKIFENEMAQKALRLEMLRWEEANGPIEDTASKLSALAGSIEMLRGEHAALRSAGAGSEILGPIQAEIDAMEAAYKVMASSGSSSPINEMQNQLKELERQGEMLNLENSLSFDGMVREIDKLANAQKELAYDDIVAGITTAKNAMASLQPQIDAATAAVTRQQTAVDQAKAASEAIQATYDAERAKLDVLKDGYDLMADTVRGVEAALRDMGSAAATAAADAERAARSSGAGAKGYLTPGEQNFLNASNALPFEEVGGFEKIGREGGMEDQSALIDEWTAELTKEIEDSFGQFDLFAGIREKWESFKSWWVVNVERNFIRFGIWLQEKFVTVGDDIANSSGFAKMQELFSGIGDVFARLWELGQSLWGLFRDDFAKIGEELSKIGGKLAEELGPELAKFKEMWPGLKKILEVVWGVIKTGVTIAFGALVAILKVAASILSNVLGPAIDIVIGIIRSIIQTVRGFANILIGIFTGDLGMIVKGVQDIFFALKDGIWSILKGLGQMVWGAVKGLVEGVVDFFVWLWDELVGHSIIPDMINAIIAWFKSLPGKVWDAIKSLVDKVVSVAVETWDKWTETVSEKWDSFIKWLKERPKNAYDNFIKFKDKIVEVATNAWDAWDKAVDTAWTNITTWLRERPQKAYDAFIKIKDKIVDVAKAAWKAWDNAVDTAWANVTTWLKERPQKVYDNIIAIRDKLRDAASVAMAAMKSKLVEMWDGKNGILTWVKGLPGTISTALSSIGTKVANGIKTAWNSAAKWINTNGIANVNKVTSKFGFSLGNLPTFEGGGVIPGRVSRKDNTIIAARTGEGVIVPELVKLMGGARGVNAANRAAQQGHRAIGGRTDLPIEGFANGGVIGDLLKRGTGYALSKIIGGLKEPIRSLIPGRPFAEDWFVGALQGWADKASQWGKDKDQLTALTGNAGGNGVLPGIGVAYQLNALYKKFPWIKIFSTYRPGAVTATGYQSYHGKNRAVDMSPSMAVFNWIHDTYGRNTKELIFSPARGKEINNGRYYTPAAITRSMHWDHVHWAYDKGGVLPPGYTMAYNGTGKNEYTLTNADWNTLSNVMASMDRITAKRSAMGSGGSAVATLGSVMSRVEARLRAAEMVTAGGGRGGDVHMHFHGDLSFPEVRSGSDAETFIRNLKGLAGE